MRHTRRHIVVAGMALFLAVEGTAHAAKGVKKVAPGNYAPRMVSGVVLSIAHKNGSGTFHVRTAKRHKKLSATNATGVAGGNQQYYSHEFHVNGTTRFGLQSGAPASFASLRSGERVRVQATGHQAIAVMIMSNHRVRGNFTRHRVYSYRPHLYQAHLQYQQHSAHQQQQHAAQQQHPAHQQPKPPRKR